MSGTSVVIGLVLLGFLAQYVLGWKQAQRFSRQVTQLRRSAGDDATVSVGVGRHRGRRAYVAIVTDADKRTVLDALVMNGATVFATGRACPELVGAKVKALVRQEVTAGSTVVRVAARQAAEFLLERSGKASARSAA